MLLFSPSNYTAGINSFQTRDKFDLFPRFCECQSFQIIKEQGIIESGVEDPDSLFLGAECVCPSLTHGQSHVRNNGFFVSATYL